MRQESNSAFISDVRGTIAITFAVSFIALAVTMGLAIDGARYYSTTSDLQAALDSASLAAAKRIADDNVTDDDVKARAQAIFDAKINTSNSRFTSMDPLDITVNRTENSVAISASGMVRSLFGPLFSQPALTNVGSAAKSTYAIQNVELAMVLDITGSMNSGTKLSDLKLAAKDVVDELMGAAVNENNVRVALVPYSASVNAGPVLPAISATVGVTTQCTPDGHGGQTCVSVPSPSVTGIDTCYIERPAGSTDEAPSISNELQKVTSLPFGNYICPSAEISPLRGRSQKDAIKADIDGLTAMGATAGHIGTEWGWYMLSPKWASLLPSGSQPKAYGTDSLTKAVLIMTDGVFNTSFINGPSTPGVDQANESYARFQQVCSDMRSQGIKVYTVGFALFDPRALTELQNCASGLDHFFDPQTGADLRAAFKSIAQKLTELRISS